MGSCIWAIEMAKLNIFHVMIPSIYHNNKSPNFQKKEAKSHIKRTKKQYKVPALICGLSAILALLLTFIVLFHTSKNSTVKKHQDLNTNHIKYIRKHPKNLHKLDNKDVFISVKTTAKNHQSRLDAVIGTWYQLARDHAYFFTDRKDPIFEAKVNPGHLIVTRCGDSHSRQDLCCKMSAEFDAFLESNKKGFCHFDDDNYVNVPRLVDKLSQFDHRKDWYLGKPSLPEPLEILDRDNNHQQTSVRFWFATGGAGFCLSQSLASKMIPLIGGGKFEDIGDKIRLPDDVTMGYVAEHSLGVPLTVISDFHSHMEPHKALPGHDSNLLAQGISYSYVLKEDSTMPNVLDIPDALPIDEDPTRFKSLHCKLFSIFSWC